MIFFFDCPCCGKRAMKRHRGGGNHVRRKTDEVQMYRRRYKCLECGAKATAYETLYHDTVSLPGESPTNGNDYRITERAHGV